MTTTRIFPIKAKHGDIIHVIHPKLGQWLEKVDAAGRWPSRGKPDVSCVVLEDTAGRAAERGVTVEYGDWIVTTPTEDLERIERVFAHLCEIHAGNLDEVAEVVRIIGTPVVSAHWQKWIAR